MGVGIWTLQAEYGNKQLSTLISAAVYRFDSVLMITVGSAIIVITLMGFCGVYTQYKCIMGLVSHLQKMFTFLFKLQSYQQLTLLIFVKISECETRFFSYGSFASQQ